MSVAVELVAIARNLADKVFVVGTHAGYTAVAGTVVVVAVLVVAEAEAEAAAVVAHTIQSASSFLLRRPLSVQLTTQYSIGLASTALHFPSPSFPSPPLEQRIS